MPSAENLDELIKEYSKNLMKTYEKRSPVFTERENVPVEPPTNPPVQQPEPDTEETPQIIEETPEFTGQPGDSATDAGTDQGENIDLDNLTGSATFFATVRTGGGAYPVPNAKIIIGKDDTVVSFLVTDENGDTQKVTLPAYPTEDALSPDTVKEVEYYADVFATGFETKRNLQVSAVGGSEIVLNIELTPLQERME